jgi:hypothetical protein
VADVLVAVGADPGREVSDQRVEDDEGGIEAGDDGIEDGQVAREGKGAASLGAIGDSDEGGDAPRITTGGVDAGADGVEDVVLGREEEDAAGCTRFGCVTREGLAAGNAGGELAEQGALTETGVAVEDGDLA